MCKVCKNNSTKRGCCKNNSSKRETIEPLQYHIEPTEGLKIRGGGCHNLFPGWNRVD